jgi:outer membrane lipoprotein-sorting protein
MFKFIVFLLPGLAFAITGLEVMQKVDKAGEGFIGSESTMTLTLINAYGEKIEREMESMALENNDDGNKSITEFIKPLDVKGTKLLTWTMKKDNNKQWLYLPRFKRIKKITSSGQSGSFMGSEFSYEDIAGNEIEKYDYKLLSENDKTWVVEARPKNDSGYSKIISTISKDKLIPIKAEYYDRKEEKLKVSVMDKFKTYKVKTKTFNYSNYIKMDNLQTKKASIIEWKNRSIGVKHKDSDFKSTKLK